METADPRTSRITSLLSAMGILSCLYLGMLKLMDLPCLLDGCSVVINSRYGSLWGLPVAAYAIPLWLCLTLKPTGPRIAWLQFCAAAALAVGSAGFMVIQFLVLRAFCAFCTLHAAFAMLIVFTLRRWGRASGWIVPGVLVFVLPLMAAIRHWDKIQDRREPWQLREVSNVKANPVQPSAATRTQGAEVPPTGRFLPSQIPIALSYRWLGDINDQSSVLIIGFQCAHCLDLMEEASQQLQAGAAQGPKILVTSHPASRENTVAVLAAILAAGEGQSTREAFAMVVGRLKFLREPILINDSRKLRELLLLLFPTHPQYLHQAEEAHAAQAALLVRLSFRGTPLLITPEGHASYTPKVSDLLLP